MTYEEVKNRLKPPCLHCKAFYICAMQDNCEDYQAYRKAVEAIEKQVPRKIAFDRHHGVYVCPNCENELGGTNATNWCTYCGQKLDWSDDK